MVVDVSFAVGLCLVAYVSLKVVLFGWRMIRLYVLPSYGFVKDLRGYGEWAIVTGATDGIGLAYARELARRGLKILLIGRSVEKLQQTSSLIRAESGVETRSVCFDFSTRSDYGSIENEIKGMDIGLLVNNVGMSVGSTTSLYADIDLGLLKRVVDVNIMPEVHLTHMVLKGMELRKRGLIVHVSSGTTHASIPFLGVYGSTKAFVSYFARVLQLEASSLKGVHHQLLIPHEVATNMSAKPQSFNRPSPQAYAKSAVGTIGLSSEVSGYWVHELERVLADVVPTWLANMILSRVVASVRKKSV